MRSITLYDVISWLTNDYHDIDYRYRYMRLISLYDVILWLANDYYL